MARAKRILAIEDDPALLGLLLRMLRSAGLDGVGASDAATALSFAAATAFDAVLLDRCLPDRPGLSVAGELRAGGFVGRIVLISADVPHELDPVLAELDLEVLGKPFTITELLDTLLRAEG